MSRFISANTCALPEISALSTKYRMDRHPSRVNLLHGVYCTDELKHWTLPVVRKAELMIAANELGHEYKGPFGIEEFRESAIRLLLGAENRAIVEKRAFGIQSIAGTGGLMIGLKYLQHVQQYNTVYIPTLGWENHKLIATLTGFTAIRNYRYWDGASHRLDIQGMLEDLRAAPDDAVVILHACAHNPSGVDPTPAQWTVIADVIEERRLFPFFDITYQGFASGDVDRDAYAVRHFVNRGLEVFCAQSFSKNFGLYDERVGCLSVVVNDSLTAVKINTEFLPIVRGLYINPPVHGARIVAIILNDEALYEEWNECLKAMSTRLRNIRRSLRENIERLHTPGSWAHITDSIGMFAISGLSEAQVSYLRDVHHIYMLSDGRLAFNGMNADNVEYVAKAINEAVLKYPLKYA